MLLKKTKFFEKYVESNNEIFYDNEVENIIKWDLAKICMKNNSNWKFFNEKEDNPDEI